MANIKSAIKRHKQALKRRSQNRLQRSSMRTYIKSFLKKVDAGDKAAAEEALHSAFSHIDRTGRRGIIHPNKAARLKGRLNNRFNKAFQ
jgi:small subunit ribosomal protein S20